MNLFNWLFQVTDYSLGWREIDSTFPVPKDGQSECPKYNTIDGTCFQWYADPFPFERDGRRFIFVEMMPRFARKGNPGGTICVIELFSDGTYSKPCEIIKEPFHLSFPNVFECNGEVFMIPESGHNGDIRLYRATDFPYKWKLDKILLKNGENLVDSSLLPFDSKLLLITYDWNHHQTLVYQIDMQEKSLLPMSVTNLINERPGGNAVKHNGCYYRVLQDCSETYGRKIIFTKLSCEHDDLTEHIVGELSEVGIETQGSANYVRIHTFNRSNTLEIIDLQRTYYNPLKRVAWIYNKLINSI